MLLVRVSGCDVEVVPSEVPLSFATVNYRRWGRGIRHEFLRWTSGVGPGFPYVKSVVVLNPDKCQGTFDRSCYDTCRVTLHAPNDTYGFWIYQDLNDKSEQVEVRIRSGVRLQELRVVGQQYWEDAGPSILLRIEPGVEIDNVAAFTDAGAIESRSDGIKAASLWSRRNSVRLLNWSPRSNESEILWRQPENRACIRVADERPSALVEDAGGVWKGCNILEYGLSYTRLVGAFDINGNGFVDAEELNKGLADNINYCCGSECPFFTYCGGIEAQMFDFAYQGRSGIVSARDFAARVHALNLTSWVRECARSVLVQHTGTGEGTAAASPFRSSYDREKPEGAGVNVFFESSPSRAQLFSEGGEVQAHIVPGGPAAALPAVTAWAPAGRIPEVRMLKRDADLIRSEITQVHGVPGPDTPDTYIVLDVMASPGVPRSRWIYTTREFFLALEPFNLVLLSGGVLVPRIRHFRVHFTNAACRGFEGDAGGDELTEEELAARYDGFVNPPTELTVETAGRVFQQLKTALLPRYQRELNGVLVLINGTHRPAPRAARLAVFSQEPSGGPARVSAVPYASPLKRLSEAGAAISVAMALVIGALAVIGILRFCRHTLRRRRRAQQLRRRLVLMQAEPEGLHGTHKALRLAEKGKTSWRESFNPFETPLALIRSVVVEPLRRAVVDSVRRFVHDRCVEYAAGGDGLWRPRRAHRGSAATAEEPRVLLPVFFKQYVSFCLDENLKPLPDIEDVQRRLIGRHGARIRMLRFRRLRGCRWRDPEAVLEACNGGSWPRGAAAWPDTGASGEAVERFLRAHVAATGRREDVLDVFRPGEGHEPAGGVSLQTALRSWASCSGLPAPDLSEIGNEALAGRAGASGCESFRVKEVVGVRLRDAAGELRPRRPWKWYLMELLTVLAHVGIMLAPPAVCVPVALEAQQTYALTTAAPGTDPLMWHHVLRSVPDLSGKHVALSAGIILWVNAAYVAATLLRISAHYLELDIRGRLAWAIRKGFAWVLMAYLCLVIGYCALVAIWFSLAAVIDPSRFLPYGVAVVVVVAVSIVLWKSMRKAAEGLRQAVRRSFQRQLDLSFSSSGLKGLPPPVGSVRKRPGKAPGTEKDEEQQEAREGVRPEDIFDALNTNEDETLSLGEFQELFRRVDLPLGERRRQRLFAYCDLDCTETVTREEFAEGWGCIVDEMMNEIMLQHGLGAEQIAATIAVTVALLILWFAFLFLLISVWNSTGSFEAAVQSLIIAGSGSLSAKASVQTEEVRDHSLDWVVMGAMGGAADAADEE